jgi:D-amino-acid oxidase
MVRPPVSTVAARPSGNDAVVVGAGVIGLTTGVCLAEAGLSTRIVTAEPRERTTSYAAGAICGPVLDLPGIPMVSREQAGFDEFTMLAGGSGTGVRLCDGMFVAPAGMTGVPPMIRPAEVRVLDPGDVPAGYESGFMAVIPCVDMPRYLAYLTERFERAGGVVESRRLASLAEAAEIAPLVANCAGLGARDLVPDQSVRPVRGQHVVVENPGIDRVFMEPPFGPAWVGIVPHVDVVVLGGIAVENDWNLEPDPAVADEILRRCVVVEPRLRDAPIVEHRVGLRPGRPSVRLDREELDGAVVVHDYGHGGSGVLLSWGCAREALALLSS